MSISRNLGFMIAGALAVAGCGGGGGGSSVDGDAATGITAGTITAFGSIVVNGKHLEVDGPDVEIEQDGDDLDEKELEIGMMVRVDDDGGRHVEVEEAVRGPVDAVAGDEVTVMGQTVRTDAGTVLDDLAALGDLDPGDVVEVAGLRGTADAIEATYVELKAGDTSSYRVTGRVTDHDPGALTFRVGGLTIDYQSAALDDLPDGSWNDLVVEVKDANRTYVPASSTLVATKVEREDPAGGAVGEEVEIERIVTAVNGDDTFVVGGDLLVRSGGAEFRLGTAADLVVGTRVEIEGRILADGSLRAEEIKFDDNDVRIAGIVEAVDAAAQELEVLGVTVDLAGSVELEGFGALADLVAGVDFVEIEGRLGPSGRVLAHEIELEDEVDDRELRGPVSRKDAAAGTLRIVGIDVTVGGGTELEVEDLVLSRSAFFARIAPDATIVEAKWNADGFTSTANVPESVEIEDDEDDEYDD